MSTTEDQPVFNLPKKPAAAPTPPGHLKQSKTIPAKAPQSKAHARVSSKQKVGMPGHGRGHFPAAPPKGRS